MNTRLWKKIVLTITSTAILSLGFAQFSVAGVIDTQQMIDAENRQDAIARIEATLLRDDIAEQLIEQGVDPGDVVARVQHLTTAELLSLDGQIEEHIAGGSALGLIGAAFLILLILELVGVTDIFKSF
jgi:hypothetical protein